MSLAGWILLTLSCGTITGLVVFCYWRILTAPKPKDDLRVPPDIDTRDA